MARLSAEGWGYLTDLVAHYERIERPEAIRRLVESMETALRLADDPTTRLRRFPATYDEISVPGVSWFKVHRYWFGCRRDDRAAAVTIILDDRSDMPRRLKP